MNYEKHTGKSHGVEVTIRCYAELNDFLPTDTRQKDLTITLKTAVTVAEALELLGIPLSEVDLVLVNSEPVERDHRLHHHDLVSIYPTFETFNIGSLKTTQKQPLRITRFILDAHLGKLAKYLRMLGFDTLYRNDFGDNEIIQIAQQENRIILSRDKLLLKSTGVDHGYYVRSIEKHEQLVEIVKKFDLYSQFNSFSRCMTCNALLQKKIRSEVREMVNPETFAAFNEFFFCPDCRKVFWKGSHFERMERLILAIINERLR
jgi:uncharacterized protein with PIN domain